MPTWEQVTNSLRVDNEQLREINAELLAALQEIKRETDQSRDFRSAAACAAIAQAAIAKATGTNS